MDVVLSLLSQNGKWRVSLRTYHERVEPLRDADLAAVRDAPGTWDEVIARIAPRKDWRLDGRMMRALGELLRSRLITGRVAEAVRRDEEEARRSGASLRFLVHVPEDEQDELLRKLPLELICDQTFWFRRERVIGARLPDVPDEGEVDFGVARRAVVAWASKAGREPSDEQLHAHAEKIGSALGGARFEVEILERCTTERLIGAIKKGCELLYLACHGVEDLDGKGKLLLADRALSGVDLGEWLYDVAEAGRRTQAVLLGACSTAALHGTWSSGMAQYLAGGRIAMAAIGFRAPVSVVDALPLMEAIAAGIARGDSFEAAVCNARRAMPADAPDWVLPLLFTRPRPPAVARVVTMPRSLHRVASILPAQPRLYFLAREAELRELRQALSKPGVQVLTAGEGGIGKTEIARVLAHQSDSEGRLVLWLEKADVDPVRSLAALVKHADPRFEVRADASTETLRAKLAQELGTERGLLVLDDLVSDACVAALTPGGSWSVLVTSRDARLLPGAPRHVIEPFDLGTAAALLARLAYDREELPAEHAASAGALLEVLAGVPLLIETAAALLRDGYEYEEVLADAQRGTGDVHFKAEALLARSLEQLSEKDRFAWYVVAAWYNVTALSTAGAHPRYLAVALAEPESVADRRLRRLQSHSLVRGTQDKHRVTMHPLTRQIAMEHAKRSGLRGAVREAAVKAVLSADMQHEARVVMDTQVQKDWRDARDEFTFKPSGHFTVFVELLAGTKRAPYLHREFGRLLVLRGRTIGDDPDFAIYEAMDNILDFSNRLIELASAAIEQGELSQALELLAEAEPLVEQSRNLHARDRITALRKQLPAPSSSTPTDTPRP